MQRAQAGRATTHILLWLTALAFAGANLTVFVLGTQGVGAPVVDTDLLQRCPLCLLYFALAPLAMALFVTLLVRRTAENGKLPAPETAPAKPVPASPQAAEHSALVLLGLLQREGRLLDFLAEDLSAYSDAQIGAAVRAIHAGCRKALEGRLQVEPVLAGQEGEQVTVETPFDPTRIRLAGNVTGGGPYRGILRHPGWKVTRLDLPQPLPGSSPEVVAPAEVDLT